MSRCDWLGAIPPNSVPGKKKKIPGVIKCQLCFKEHLQYQSIPCHTFFSSTLTFKRVILFKHHARLCN